MITSDDGNGRVSELLAGFDGKPANLIPMLQMVQKEFGYLPQNALLEIARLTRLSPASVYGVATFYAQFRLQPIGKYIIKVCRGTACHVSGSDLLLDHIQNYLQVTPGQTTKDGLFTLETVACFGCCALAPVVVVNDHVYALMTAAKTTELLDELRQAESGAGETLEVSCREG
ncbi:MAG: NADH-quinone oxidoreductase subunit NuoE [Candidatus Abyssobacteria bacterium SURF_5]|uniref:NADH-quinone oxidoreductase subunit NuoE n=1 Tax=Abyssobacteria bacterium (strain SURF_5) TaxID=2093360 RepID=A0A3A4PA63_ABYX5|nr:MAG: NADH-quinone oxidoreductase subunit NuoE [Candidatus Abyssubacteria bacterium SURF_5]